MMTRRAADLAGSTVWLGNFLCSVHLSRASIVLFFGGIGERERFFSAFAVPETLQPACSHLSSHSRKGKEMYSPLALPAFQAEVPRTALSVFGKCANLLMCQFFTLFGRQVKLNLPGCKNSDF